MARIAYRLWTIKDETSLMEEGLSKEDANSVIDLEYDVDEDYTSKKEYMKSAKEYVKEVKNNLGITVSVKALFGLPEDIGYRYCSKCDCFYWEDDGCECEG